MNATAPSVFDPVTLALGLGLGLGVVALLFVLTGGRGSRRLAKRVERMQRRAAGDVESKLTLRVGVPKAGLDGLLWRIVPRPELIRQRLARTGRSIGLAAYLMVSLGVAVVAALFGLVAGLPLWVAAAKGLLAGLWLPHLAVSILIMRRLGRFSALFPEAIGLIVRGLKSGLPITESMAIVGREIADPVGEEFRKIGDQVRLGQSLDQALGDAMKRNGLPEFKFLVIALSVQRETGGNLAETLENLDQILRRRRQVRLKIRAMSSEARASAGILAALPLIMLAILSLVSPTYIATLFTEDLGHTLMAAGLSSMVVGIGVMAKMVRFEI